jgi:hypothetical protein
MHVRRVVGLIALAVSMAACSGTSSPTAQSGGTGASPAGTTGSGAGGGGSPATPAAGGGSGANGFEGSITSSGVYAATWTVPAGSDAEPFNASGSRTVSSDKGTFGNVKVMPDGSIAFGSAAPELNANSSYDGSGAKVTLDSTGQFVCAFTVDNDLKGNHDGAILHLAGSLAAHWHPLGSSEPNCP